MDNPPDFHRMMEAGDVEGLIKVLGHPQAHLRMQASDLLIRMGEPAVTALITGMDDANPEVRKGCIRALGGIGNNRAVVPLLRHLRREDAGVAQFIIDALAELGDPRAVPALCRMTRNPSLILRYNAVRALGEFHDRRSIPFLIDALSDNANIVRLRAIDSLSSIDEATLWSPISELMDDPSPGVRAQAARAMGKLKARGAIHHLLRMLSSKVETDRIEAVRALGELGGQEVRESLELARILEGQETGHQGDRPRPQRKGPLAAEAAARSAPRLGAGQARSGGLVRNPSSERVFACTGGAKPRHH